MGATYTRQSSFTDGDTITADLFNNEYDQLLAAFATSGHSHDGTAAEGGAITKLLGTAITIGTNGADVAVTFDGQTNDGLLTWMEDEDYFQFSDDLLLTTTEKVQFRDTAIYINSSADGQLDIVADTEIQIAATTIDMNGAADISGNLAVGGNLTVAGNATVTGTTTFNGGTLTLGDAASDNVVFGADVNSSIIPNTDSTFDLGSSSQEWRDLFLDGTAHIDTLDVDVNATVAGTLGVTGDTTLAATSITSITADTILATDKKVQFRDTGLFINSSADGQLDIVADTEVQIAATTVDINGAVDISGALVVGGDLTITGDDLIMATNTAGALLIADGTNFNPTVITDLSEIGTAASGDILLAIDASGGGLKKVTRSTLTAGLASDSAISNLVEDTSPQLGGNLDTNSQNILIDDAHFIGDESGNEQLIFQTTGSAVNQLEITNAASGSGPILASTGGDTNINLNLTPKGTGVVMIDGFVGIEAGLIDLKNSGSAVSQIKFYCESSNAHAQTLIGAPHAESGSNTLTLPSTGGNSRLLSAASTATVTNKTFTSPKINEDVAVTSTATELNLLDGVTSTTAELNILDGVTSTAAELNALDGITAVVGELNALDIGSTAVGTAVASKAVILDSNKDYTGLRNFTVTGELDAATLDISGNADIDGTTNLDVVDIDGAVDMASTLLVTGVATLTAKPIANAGMSVKNGATSAGFVEFFEDSDNGANKVTLIGPASTADITLTLPSAAGTLITSASAIDEATALAIALG